MDHELKCWPEFFKAISLEHKRFEYRRNDRNFQPEDTLHLREFDPFHKNDLYTGNRARVIVLSVWNRLPEMHPDFCIMDIKLVSLWQAK